MGEQLPLFDSALSAIGNSVTEAHINTTLLDYDEVDVFYADDSFDKDTKEEWIAVLDEWIPRFDEAGWLDELTAIQISDHYMEKHGATANTGAMYHLKEQTVCFPQNPHFDGPPWIVGTTKEYAVLHEMTHHVHIRDAIDAPLEETDTGDLRESPLVERFVEDGAPWTLEVSDYAGANFLEAVAETCSGIMLGNDYSPEVRRAYKKLDGPEPIVNWEEPSPPASASSTSNSTVTAAITFDSEDSTSSSGDETFKPYRYD